MKQIVRNFRILLEICLHKIKDVQASSNLVQVLLGPRQVGKTNTTRSKLASTAP
jgi:predicted AAA+ superfamily ATPase